MCRESEQESRKRKSVMESERLCGRMVEREDVGTILLSIGVVRQEEIVRVRLPLLCCGYTRERLVKVVRECILG